MTCTQNHKDPKECLVSDCTPIFSHIHCIGSQFRIGSQFQRWHKPEPKQSMTPDETFIQWLKIIGLTIALGVMVYQTYLLRIISER